MEATATHIRIRSSTLRVELLASEQMIQQRDVHPGDVGDLLHQIGWVCGAARAAAALPYPRRISSRAAERWEPRVSKVEYGSPFSVVVDLPDAIVTSVIAMSLIIYSLKRLWKLPVEFRTYDRKVEEKYLEAEAKAREAELRLEEVLRRSDEARKLRMRRHSREAPGAPSRNEVARKESDAERKEQLEAVDGQFEWPRGSAAGIEARRSSDWQGESALWTADGEDS